jgi:hypothetical protein
MNFEDIRYGMTLYWKHYKQPFKVLGFRVDREGKPQVQAKPHLWVYLDHCCNEPQPNYERSQHNQARADRTE